MPGFPHPVVFPEKPVLVIAMSAFRRSLPKVVSTVLLYPAVHDPQWTLDKENNHKDSNSAMAIVVTPDAIPPKPKTAATTARMKKTRAHQSIVFPPGVNIPLINILVFHIDITSAVAIKKIPDIINCQAREENQLVYRTIVHLPVCPLSERQKSV